MPNSDYLARFRAQQRYVEAQKHAQLNQEENEYALKWSIIETANRLLAENSEMTHQMAETFWGESMHVDLPEMVGIALFLTGFHEADVTSFMIEMIEPGMTVIDIGAHCGADTLLAAALTGTDGEVHAFEPMPETFAILARNTTGRKNITIRQCAVWNEATTLMLRDFGPQLSGMSTTRVPRIPLPPQFERPPVAAPSVTLDAYVDENALAPDFIKIDVEGAEPEVIQGMENIIGQFRPALVLELVDAGPSILWSCRQVVEYLCERGYQPIEYDDKANGLRPHQRSRYYNQNLLFIAAR